MHTSSLTGLLLVVAAHREQHRFLRVGIAFDRSKRWARARRLLQGRTILLFHLRPLLIQQLRCLPTPIQPVQWPIPGILSVPMLLRRTATIHLWCKAIRITCTLSRRSIGMPIRTIPICIVHAKDPDTSDLHRRIMFLDLEDPERYVLHLFQC